MSNLLERVLVSAEARRAEWERLARQVGSVSQQVAELRGRIEAHQRVLEQLVAESGGRTTELRNMAASVLELHREVLAALGARDAIACARCKHSAVAHRAGPCRRLLDAGDFCDCVAFLGVT